MLRQKHLHVVLLAGQRNNLQVGVWQPVLGTGHSIGGLRAPEENAVMIM